MISSGFTNTHLKNSLEKITERTHRSSDNDMKILQLGKAYPPVNLGGIEVTIALFCTGLVEKGHHCDALGINDKYKFSKEKIGKE